MTKKKLRAKWAKRLKSAFGLSFIDSAKIAKSIVNDTFTYDFISYWKNQDTVNYNGDYYDGVFTITIVYGLDGSRWVFHNKHLLWDYEI